MRILSTLSRMFTGEPYPRCGECKWIKVLGDERYNRCHHPKMNQDNTKYLSSDSQEVGLSFCHIERAPYGRCGARGWYFEPKVDGIKTAGGLRL